MQIRIAILISCLTPSFFLLVKNFRHFLTAEDSDLIDRIFDHCRGRTKDNPPPCIFNCGKGPGAVTHMKWHMVQSVVITLCQCGVFLKSPENHAKHRRSCEVRIIRPSPPTLLPLSPSFASLTSSILFLSCPSHLHPSPSISDQTKGW